MSMEVSKVYPETRCQGLSAPGITANYICKDEAMRWIFNHSVDCNLKQVLNNVHVCTSGGKHVPKCNSKGCFYFFSVAKIHPTGFVSKGKENWLKSVKKMLKVVEASVFLLLSQVCVYLWGFAFYPIQEGSQSRGPRGSNRLQTPCELPEGNLGLVGSALPQHPWQRWTPSETCHVDETATVASRSMSVCSGGRRRSPPPTPPNLVSMR